MPIYDNWSTINRHSIIEHTMTISGMLVNRTLPVNEFHTILTNHIKKLLPVRVRKIKNIKVFKNQVWVGGLYHADYDEKNQKCIELIINYSPTDTICISKKQMNGICYIVADTVMHELIHMRQYRRRNFRQSSYIGNVKFNPEQKYLGCPDEIDAYSFNIACELHDKFNGNKNQINKYLSTDQKSKQESFNNWIMYLKTFQYDRSHPILKKVKSKVIKYLPQAKLGKPYNTKNWLYY